MWLALLMNFQLYETSQDTEQGGAEFIINSYFAAFI